MELDELKTAWQALDRRFASQQALTLGLLQQVRTEKVRRALWPTMWAQGFETVLGLAGAFASAAFWWAHRDVPHLVAIGVVMQVYFIALIVFGVRMQGLLAQVNAGVPVLDLQRRIALLRQTSVRGGIWLGLSWWVLWIPGVVMIVRAVSPIDLITLMPQVIGWNIAAGVAGILGSLALIRRLRARPERERMIDGVFAARGVTSVQAVLDELAHFEQE